MTLAYVIDSGALVGRKMEDIIRQREELAALQARTPLPQEDPWEVEQREKRHAERMRLQQEADAQRAVIRAAEINAVCNRVLREKEAAEKQQELAINIGFDSMAATDAERRKVTLLVKQKHPQKVNDPNLYLSLLIKLRNAGSGERPKGSLAV